MINVEDLAEAILLAEGSAGLGTTLDSAEFAVQMLRYPVVQRFADDGVPGDNNAPSRGRPACSGHLGDRGRHGVREGRDPRLEAALMAEEFGFEEYDKLSGEVREWLESVDHSFSFSTLATFDPGRPRRPRLLVPVDVQALVVTREEARGDIAVRTPSTTTWCRPRSPPLTRCPPGCTCTGRCRTR